MCESENKVPAQELDGGPYLSFDTYVRRREKSFFYPKTSCHSCAGFDSFHMSNKFRLNWFSCYREKKCDRQIIILYDTITGLRSRPALVKNSGHPGFAPKFTNPISLKAVWRLSQHYRSIWDRNCQVFFLCHKFSELDYPHSCGLSGPSTVVVSVNRFFESRWC